MSRDHAAAPHVRLPEWARKVPFLRGAVVLFESMRNGYGALRFSTALFTELREILFARVTQRAVRQVALEVFRHLHALSLRFHLERQTGGVSRDVERGSRSISSLISYTLYSLSLIHI